MSFGKLFGGLANSITTGIVAGQNRDFAAQQLQKQQDFTASQNQLNRDFAASQQLKNQQFAHYMFSNSARMRMKDLEAAGINPMLATGNNAFTAGGSGSASPKNFEKKTDQTTPGNQPSRGQKRDKISAKNVFVIK